MTKITTVFEQALAEAKKLHQSGQWQIALTKYQALCAEFPESLATDAQLNQLLGMVYFQIEQPKAAIKYYQQAIKLAPDNNLLLIQLGNIYKNIGSLEQAEQCYQTVLKQKIYQNQNQDKKNNNKTLALHNLGVLYQQQGKFDKAKQYYTEAIQLKPDYIDARYHLAICLLKLDNTSNNKKLAIAALKTTLELYPKHFSALFMLGSIYMAQQNHVLALTFFQRAQAIELNHIELQTNMGHCHLRLKQYNYARDCYRYALELGAIDKLLHFNMGVMAEAENLIDHAINHYLTSLTLDPDYFAAHHNLGLLFLQKSHIAKAKFHIEAALALQPKHETMQYMLQAIKQDPRLTAAPSEHIRQLFDQYAESYEQHMRIALDYQLPEQLFNLYTELFPLNQNKKNKNNTLSLLDLGCGTGLVAQAFQSYTQHITGVDLSKNMLAMAEQKNCYDELIQDDIEHFLVSNNTKTYDLIILADTMVYFGELDKLFNLLSKHLHPNGVLLFNVEEGDKAPYLVDQSGRFLHHPSYLNQLITQYKLKLVQAKTIISRQQNNKPVVNLVYCLIKY